MLEIIHKNLDAIRAAAQSSTSRARALESLGYPPESIKKFTNVLGTFLATHGITTTFHVALSRTRQNEILSIWEDRPKMLNMRASATSLVHLLSEAGLPNTKTQREKMRRFLSEQGAPFPDKCVKASWTDDEIFCQKSLASPAMAKNHIIQNKLMAYQCRKCTNPGFWNGKALKLSLEHKNGINDDHRLINLEFLCPNCHTQTPTFAGRNRAKLRESK